MTSLWFTGSEATNWFNAGKNQCVSFLRRRTPVTGSRTGSEGAQRSNIRCQWVSFGILSFVFNVNIGHKTGNDITTLPEAQRTQKLSL